MKKKLLCSVFLFLFLLCEVPASAQTLTVGSISGKQGDTLTIPVNFTNDANNVFALEFDLVLDPSLVTLTEIIPGILFQNFDFGSSEIEPGRFTILIFPMTYPFHPLPSGEAARLKITILETVASIDINFQDVEMIDSTGEKDILPAEINNGSVTNPLVPTADAGEDQTLFEGTQVMLNALASVNPEGGGVLSYQWRQTSGITVTLSDANSPQPTFITPEVDEAGVTLTFELTIRNGIGFEDTDEVTINVSDTTPILSLNADLLNVPEISGTTSVEVANTGTGIMTWTAASDTEWMTITQGTGTDAGTITIRYKENTGEARIGKVIVTAPDAGNSPQEFEVIQESVDWIKIDTGVSAHLRGIWGSSETNIFAVGRDGVILHYDGDTWKKMTSNTLRYLRGVWGSSANDVFAVGYSGTILHYDGNDAGIWEEMTSGTLSDLNNIWGNDGNDIFAVGEAGTILHYDGIQWKSMSSASFVPLYHVWGSSGNNLFAVGGTWNDFTILHYDGKNWTRMPDAVFNIPYAIWGNAGNNIFAVGNAGTISRYNGATWTEMTGNTDNYLRGVWGNSSGSKVFAVGVGGIILRYDGNEWQKMTVGASDDLFGIWGSSERNIFAVGNAGTILCHAFPGLSVTPAVKEVSAASGITTFEVVKSGAGSMLWRAATDVPWLTIDGEGIGTDNGTITVKYEMNSNEVRIGKITVTPLGADGPAQIVEVRQGRILRGDVDGNGMINLGDAVLALKVLTGSTDLDDIFIHADVNTDGRIGIEDVIYILRVVGEII